MREALLAIVRHAGEIIRRREDMVIEEKEGHANFVTTIDENVQAYLLDALAQLRPDAVAIGEEKINEALSDEPTWIVDPVDGTTNLIHDYRASAVSIALLQKREPVAGAVYNPYTDEFFYAEKGKGATLNGRPIHVSQFPLDKALVGFGTSPYDAELARVSLDMAHAFLVSAADIRRCGSAALDLAHLACGRHDVFFELNLKPWDYAAGALLVTEAGGTFEMPRSENGVDFAKNTAILATNGVCLDAVHAVYDPFMKRL
ncbi:MAG: inositol monophosphatase [Clostridia bacterium]|nr:inositol monophosphatase [Clostridia bacterium]